MCTTTPKPTSMLLFVHVGFVCLVFIRFLFCFVLMEQSLGFSGQPVYPNL